jgi:predicted ester cyclase
MAVKKSRKQSMQGFDEDYSDIVDYILKITHRIWEEKGIGLIYRYYHNESKVHSPILTNTGINSVISGTLQTLHSFPDRRLIAENVIWSGNDQAGFFSSHRILSTGTNMEDSCFGPANGRKVVYRTIADCCIFANRIHEEWLVRDNLYLVKQLGFDPVEVAKKLAMKGREKAPAFQSNFGVGENMEGQYMPNVFMTKKDDKFEIGEFILEMYNKVWEWRLFNYVKDFYADNATVHFICNRDLVGHNQIQGMLISLFASFPNARFVIDRVTCNQRNSEDDWDVAVRWRLYGLNEGIGYFGYPSGKPVEIVGITHFRVYKEKIIEEWMVFDGLDVLRQIYIDSADKFESKSSE